jgi:ABC-type uncharacterized transport system auxiliary subunit
MMMTRLWWLSVLILSLSGCATELPPTSYYVLGLPLHSPTRERPALPYSLSVGRFKADPPLLRRAVVWRTENQVGYYTYEKWAELPSRLFSHRLYRRASGAGLFERVELGNGGAEADLTLKGTLLAFEEVNTPQGAFGRVEIEAYLSKSDGTPIWSGTVGKEVPVEGENAKAAVRAITQAAEEAITSLLSSLQEALD